MDDVREDERSMVAHHGGVGKGLGVMQMELAERQKRRGEGSE